MQGTAYPYTRHMYRVHAHICPALSLQSSLSLSRFLHVSLSVQHVHATHMRLLVRAILLLSSSKDAVELGLINAASPRAQRDPFVRDVVDDEVPRQRHSTAAQAETMTFAEELRVL